MFALFDNYEKSFMVIYCNRKDNNMAILIRLYLFEEESYMSRRMFVVGLLILCTLLISSSVQSVSQMHEGNGESDPDMVEEERLVWKCQEYIAEPLVWESRFGAAVLGDLDTYGISVQVPQNAFEQNTKVVLSAVDEAVVYDDDVFNPSGGLYRLEFVGPQRRTNEPIVIKIKLDEIIRAQLAETGGLRGVHYQEGYGWHYVRPIEVNESEGYIAFQTYHNFFWGSAELSEEERIGEYVDQRTREQWAINKSDGDVDQVIEEVVKELLIDGFDADNPSIVKQIASDVTTLIINDKFSYADVVRNAHDGDYLQLGMSVAKHTGTSIAKAIEAGTLQKVVKGADTASQAAGALSEGDIQGAMEHIANYVADNYKVAQVANIAREAVRGRINNWRNDEIEQAYQVYRDGAERHGWLGGYSVDAGDFDAVWAQMAGASRQIEIDALENYRLIHDLPSIYDIPEERRDELRWKARLELKEQFETRREQEDEVARLRENNKKIIEVLDEYNMLETWRPWHSADQPIERLLDRLYDHIDQVFKDTGRTTLIHDRDDLVVRDDRGEYYRELTEADLELHEVVELIQIRLRDGHDAYFEELRKRELLPEEDKIFDISGSWRGERGDRRWIFIIKRGSDGGYYWPGSSGTSYDAPIYYDPNTGKIEVHKTLYIEHPANPMFDIPAHKIHYFHQVNGVITMEEDMLRFDGTFRNYGYCPEDEYAWMYPNSGFESTSGFVVWKELIFLPDGE